MKFDINEARAIIEAAKQRGMIKTGEVNPAGNPAPSPGSVEGTSGKAVLPDWLQEGIRQGPLVRPDSGSDRR